LDDRQAGERLRRRGQVVDRVEPVRNAALLVGQAVRPRENRPAAMGEQHGAGELVTGGELREVLVIGTAWPRGIRDLP
jgi:hypothetical protein